MRLVCLLIHCYFLPRCLAVEQASLHEEAGLLSTSRLKEIDLEKKLPGEKKQFMNHYLVVIPCFCFAFLVVLWLAVRLLPGLGFSFHHGIVVLQ
jgi:Flp pilus assembly protein TadB